MACYWTDVKDFEKIIYTENEQGLRQLLYKVLTKRNQFFQL